MTDFSTQLCRHGDRNPDPTYPNDRWDSNEYWPGGLSALTNVRIKYQNHNFLNLELLKKVNFQLKIEHSDWKAARI